MPVTLNHCDPCCTIDIPVCEQIYNGQFELDANPFWIRFTNNVGVVYDLNAEGAGYWDGVTTLDIPLQWMPAGWYCVEGQLKVEFLNEFKHNIGIYLYGDHTILYQCMFVNYVKHISL